MQHPEDASGPDERGAAGAGPPRPVRPARAAPPIVHVHPQRTGFGRMLGAFTVAIGVTIGVFLAGTVVGVVVIGVLGVWIGGTGLDEQVVWQEQRDGGSAIVAIVPVEGIIDDRQAAFVRACVQDITDNSSVKAVVLRVNSPGGGVTPSDEIWYEVTRLRSSGVPVVASFGGVAASGGYYVACDSDYIMAQATSVTGSIGVIAQIMTLEGLLEKVGVEPVTLVARASPEKSVANDVFRAWNDDDRARVLEMLDSAYDCFFDRLRAGRGSVVADPERLREIANGAVFTAQAALDNGLVDGLGYLDDAIAEAERTAGVRKGSATVMRLGERPTLFGGSPFARTTAARPAAAAWNAETIRTFVNELGCVRFMYLMR